MELIAAHPKINPPQAKFWKQAAATMRARWTLGAVMVEKKTMALPVVEVLDPNERRAFATSLLCYNTNKHIVPNLMINMKMSLGCSNARTVHGNSL